MSSTPKQYSSGYRQLVERGEIVTRERTRQLKGDSKAGREAWQQAQRQAQTIVSAVKMAGDNFNNAIGLSTIWLAQRVFMTGNFNRADVYQPDGVEQDYNGDLLSGLMFAEYIIENAIAGTLDDTNILFPCDRTHSDFARLLILRVANWDAQRFLKNQRDSYEWFQAQTHICEICGRDVMNGWHGKVLAPDDIVCESMTVLDDSIEIEF